MTASRAPGRLALLAVAAFVPCAPLRADATPPEYFARLIERGNVTFEFYDPIREPRTYRGYTTFQLSVYYRATYRYEWSNFPGGRQITIFPTVSSFSYELTNKVQLPNTLDHDGRWSHPLVHHEFDHVAMTLDPRIRMLIEHLCSTTPKISRRLPNGARIDNRFIGRAIDDAVKKRYEAVLELLLANQKHFDVVSSHGTRSLPDRAGFFGSLFTESNLKQQDFPYLSEVKPLLRKPAYRRVELPYEGCSNRERMAPEPRQERAPAEP